MARLYRFLNDVVGAPRQSKALKADLVHNRLKETKHDIYERLAYPYVLNR